MSSPTSTPAQAVQAAALTCPKCGQSLDGTANYMGIFQPDPNQDGKEGWNVAGLCSTDNISVVKRVLL